MAKSHNQIEQEKALKKAKEFDNQKITSTKDIDKMLNEKPIEGNIWKEKAKKNKKSK